MKKNEIKKFINKYNRKDWYYYYNFDGCPVRAELEKAKDCGYNNWKKISPVIYKLFKNIDSPSVLDIGCNMGLYIFEMFKRGIDATGVDIKIDHALFFQKFIKENKGLDFNSNFIQCDVTKKPIPIDSVDVITMFCVIYHLSPYHDDVIKNLPKHRYLVLQGNLPRVTSKKRNKQKLAGIDGMSELLKKHGYSIKVHKFGKYTKPLVVGEL
tara:strand:- start:14970 stop:15602 length:633 start_codon:yes stop_codon:yes gene_type:complete